MESSQMGLVIISQLYSEGKITDEERDNLKGNVSYQWGLFILQI